MITEHSAADVDPESYWVVPTKQCLGCKHTVLITRDGVVPRFACWGTEARTKHVDWLCTAR